MAGFSALRREQAQKEEDARMARALTLDALDGALTFARREQLADRLTDDEAALLAGLAGSGRPAHSLRALAGDLEHLSLWCREVTGAPLPFPPPQALVLRFLESRRAETPAPSLSTLKRRLTSWAALCRAAGGEAGVFSAAPVRATLSGPVSARAAAQPLGEEGLALLIATCEGDTLADCRDRALLMTAFALNLRPAEVAGLTLAAFARGKPRITAGPEGGAVDLPPALVEPVRQWLTRAGLRAGPLFRPVDRWGKPGRLRLTPQSVRLVVQARAKAAGLDPDAFSARSLRQP